MTNPYVQSLVDLMTANANPANAEPMQRYMRDQFPYLGIKTPERRALFKQFVAKHGLPPVTELDEAILALWALPEREYQYLAVGLLDKLQKKLPPQSTQLLEQLITTKAWWDTVDTLAARIVGTHFQRYPDIQAQFLPIWRQSDNIWLRRTAILFQLHYKTKTDVDLLFAIIHENLGSTEFFINKAIGWALREYSKTDRTAVLTFVNQTDLASLSRREALKWLKNQNLL